MVWARSPGWPGWWRVKTAHTCMPGSNVDEFLCGVFGFIPRPCSADRYKRATMMWESSERCFLGAPWFCSMCLIDSWFFRCRVCRTCWFLFALCFDVLCRVCASWINSSAPHIPPGQTFLGFSVSFSVFSRVVGRPFSTRFLMSQNLVKRRAAEPRFILLDNYRHATLTAGALFSHRPCRKKQNDDLRLHVIPNF